MKKLDHQRTLFFILVFLITLLHITFLYIYKRALEDIKKVKATSGVQKIKIQIKEKELKVLFPLKKYSSKAQKKDILKSWSQLKTNQTQLFSFKAYGEELGHSQKKCIKDIIGSFVTDFPRPLFLANIEGHSKLRLIISPKEITLNSISYSHQLIDKFVCYKALNTIKKLTKTHCLDESIRDGSRPIDIRYDFKLAEQDGIQIYERKKNQFHIIIKKFKKTALQRIPMMLLNMFTLLELIKGEKDEVQMQVLLHKLKRFHCRNLSIAL